MKAFALLPAVIWGIGFMALAQFEQYLYVITDRKWLDDDGKHKLMWFWILSTIGLAWLGLYLETRP